MIYIHLIIFSFNRNEFREKSHPDLRVTFCMRPMQFCVVISGFQALVLETYAWDFQNSTLRETLTNLISWLLVLEKPAGSGSYTGWFILYCDTLYLAAMYGGWFDWMKKWYPYRNNKNMLTLYYEDMVHVRSNSIICCCSQIIPTIVSEMAHIAIPRCCSLLW